MTKIHTKLLVFFSVIICSLCLCFGLAACNNSGGNNTGEHTHTFGGFWLFDGADGHYQFATCHPEEKSELKPHADEDGDFKCDVCDYVMHVHVDEDEDNICDDCQSEIHKHTFEEEWTFNEKKHWHNANCEHFIERSNYVDHSFVEGVCECGVKESEVKVYDLYKNSPEYEFYFPQWLDWLKDNGIISVEISESGDGVYHFADGHSEVRFVGERTVKVKAESSNGSVADAWFMVCMYSRKDNGYYSANGTIALGIAKTDENGIAEITFRPVGGYTSGTIDYHVRVALAADVANYLRIKEEDAKPLPDRYVASKDNYVSYEVGQDGGADLVTYKISFSKGWNGIEKFTLPYHRYYTNPIEATGIADRGYTYTFTTSGDNLFDYFYFAPYFIPAGYAPYNYPRETANKILENSYFAASGNYKISFAIEGTANATLYFWDENGVQLDGYHLTNSNGTPSDSYITSRSGGTAGTGKYTGGNFVNVGVSPNRGSRTFQFGLLCDSKVSVTMTVEYVSSYESDLKYQLVMDDDGTGSVTKVKLPQEDVTAIGLINVTAGLYKVNVYRSSSKYPGQVAVWTDTDKNNKVSASEGYIKYEEASPSYIDFNGVIRFTDDTTIIYIENNFSDILSTTVSIERYELPELRADELTNIPSTTSKMSETYDIKLDPTLSGSYELTINVYGSEMFANKNFNGGEKFPLTVKIGAKTYTFNMTEKLGTRSCVYTYSGTVNISEGDGTISIISTTVYSLFARVKLTASETV